MHLASVIDLFTHNTHAHTQTEAHTRQQVDRLTQLTRRRETHEGRVSKGHATDQRRFRLRPRVRVRVRFRCLLPLLCSLPRATVADTNHLRPSLRSVDAICNDIFIYTLVFFPSLSPLSVSRCCVFPEVNYVISGFVWSSNKGEKKKKKNTEVSWSSG